MPNITRQDLISKIKDQTGLSKIRAAAVIKKAGLTDVSAYPARALSQDQQQKLLKNLPAAKPKVATTINTDKPQVSISDKNAREASTSVFHAGPATSRPKPEKQSLPPVELAI